LHSAAPGRVVIKAPGSDCLGSKKNRGGRSVDYPTGSSPCPMRLHFGTGRSGSAPRPVARHHTYRRSVTTAAHRETEGDVSTFVCVIEYHEEMSETMPRSVRTDVHELETANQALITLTDHIEATTDSQSDVDTLVQVVPCCVEITDLLAVLTGRLGELAMSLVDLPGGGPTTGVTEEMMVDIAVDLETMRSLLYRATLVAAPALADLRRIPVRAQ
jgi:hypothetical protein